MQTPDEIAEQLFGQSISGNASIDMVLAAFKSSVAAALRSYGDERARTERGRAADWHPSLDKLSPDWNTEYSITITGKTLEAMQFLARYVLKSELPSFSAIAASDHLFMFAEEIRKKD